MAYRKGSPSDLKRLAGRAIPKKSKAERHANLGPGVTVNPAPGAGERGGVQEYLIDEPTLRALAGNMCSYDEMAMILKVPQKFLRDHYKHVIDEAVAGCKANLRAAQYRNATANNNVIMQIWLGKQMLGQKDTQRVEQTDGDGKPLKACQAVAYIPDNNRDGSKT